MMAATQEPASQEHESVFIGGIEYQEIPQSWVEHGSVPKHTGRARHYATSVHVDREEEQLVVRYVHPANKWVAYRRFEIERVDGLILPKVYVDDGPEAFPLHLDAYIDEYYLDAQDVYRQIEREWLRERYEDYLSASRYQIDGTVSSVGGER